MYPGTRKNFEFGTTVAAELLALKFLSPLGNWRGDSELKKKKHRKSDLSAEETTDAKHEYTFEK